MVGSSTVAAAQVLETPLTSALGFLTCSNLHCRPHLAGNSGLEPGRQPFRSELFLHRHRRVDPASQTATRRGRELPTDPRPFSFLLFPACALFRSPRALQRCSTWPLRSTMAWPASLKWVTTRGTLRLKPFRRSPFLSPSLFSFFPPSPSLSLSGDRYTIPLLRSPLPPMALGVRWAFALH